MKPRALGLAALIALSLAVPRALRGDVSFADVHFWTGDGTNSVALVVDWTREHQPGNSRVWGFRWNGETPPSVADMLLQVAREDRRLHVFTEESQWGITLNAIGYDANGNGGLFHYKKLRGGAILAEATDPEDYMDGGWAYVGYWEFLYSAQPDPTFSAAGIESSSLGIGDVAVAPGHWYVMRFAMLDWWNEDWTFDAPPIQTPIAAHSPYAWQVVDSRIDTDPVYNPVYNNPEVVLGRPALWTVAQHINGEQGSAPLVPVTPVLPSVLKQDIVSLANPEDQYGNEVTAFLTIRFDHPVVDHPLNPYGLDFIVFGNTLQTYSSGGYLTGMEDPNTVVLTAGTNPEPAWVEVSQDGLTWHRFSDGPFADDFAPTLGRVYDPANPVTNLFGSAVTNYWWGAPSDPTLPLHPSITASSLNGMTLAEAATYYNGSAGGTGFDIGQFDLPPNEQGYKWIQYVRVVSKTTWDESNWSEIDAFAIVYPDQPYDHWVRQEYDWLQLPNPAIVGKNATAANGKPNFYNAALGLSADETAPDPRILSFSVSEGIATATFATAENAQDARFFLDRTSSLTNSTVWSATLETRGPTVSDGNGGFIGTISVPVPQNSNTHFFRLGVGTY